MGSALAPHLSNLLSADISGIRSSTSPCARHRNARRRSNRLALERARQENLKALARLDVFNPLDLVFLNDEARPLDQKYVDKHLKALCAKAKIAPVSFYKLRHTAATHMVAAGVPLALVKDQLGHSSITLTTGTYAHMVPAAQREAAEKLNKAIQGW